MEELELTKETVDAYFSNLNPLASKVWSDLKKIKNSVVNYDSLSYDEKCAIIETRIAEAVQESGRQKDDRRRSMDDYLPNFGDKDYTAALLLSVYPKKSNKYDDGNGFSECFSQTSLCQVDSCNLGELMKGITVKRASKKYKAPSKPDVSSDSELDDFPIFEDEWLVHTETEDDTVLFRKDDAKKKYFMSGNCKSDTEEDEENSNQKQNLIAELQAKLKKTKLVVKESKDEAVYNPQSNGAGPGPSKISKPRAPPPPPPKSNILEEQKHLQKTEEKVHMTSVLPSTHNTLEDEDFKVDFSSPSRIATPKTGFDFLDNW